MSTDTKLTKAACNALAWLHLTGLMPSYLRHQTFMQVFHRKETIHLAKYKWREQVKPEYQAEVEAHPMVVKVRELEADGWKVAENQGRRRKVRLGVLLVRAGETRQQETSVYPDGKQCRVWG